MQTASLPIPHGNVRELSPDAGLLNTTVEFGVNGRIWPTSFQVQDVMSFALQCSVKRKNGRPEK